MDPIGLRALNPRCYPAGYLLIRPRPRPRPRTIRRSCAVSDTAGNKPSPAPKPYHASPSSASFSVGEGVSNSFPNGSSSSVGGVPSAKLLQVVLVSPQGIQDQLHEHVQHRLLACILSGIRTWDLGYQPPSLLPLALETPLGYKIEDSKLKRAGLDYWPYVVVKIHSSWGEFMEYFKQQDGDKRLLAFTKRGLSIHSDFSYRRGDWLVFGSETHGLPPEALEDCRREELGGGTIRIPMVETYVRCLNLSVSVGIALYEAARQLNYEQLRLPPQAEAECQRLFLSEDIYG
ncbi:uncharacterized protein LOC109727075 isoform X1 [Ananas comosus]|uniref:Uncharacterized protein LOC109727075 isoform X1 n=1 Tax=Ananas comosus TaxID=4615 RepID=A0A6P5H3A9_ANACO|nr:uncharacterized protein LOC109727075 isoform X1 [Ananas comosus]